MAGSLNRVELIGALGRDPEVKHFQNGGRVCSLSIATSESWTDKSSGERRTRTEWHRVVIFNDSLIGVAEKYLKKGGKVFVAGQLETRKWTDQNGIEKYTTEVVLRPFNSTLILLGGKSDGQASQQNQRQAGDYGQAQQTSQGGGLDDLNDDIPF